MPVGDGGKSCLFDPYSLKFVLILLAVVVSALHNPQVGCIFFQKRRIAKHLPELSYQVCAGPTCTGRWFAAKWLDQ